MSNLRMAYLFNWKFFEILTQLFISLLNETLLMNHLIHVKAILQWLNFTWNVLIKGICFNCCDYCCVLGLDLCFGRWDNSLHRLIDFGSAIRPPAIKRTVIKIIFSIHFMKAKVENAFNLSWLPWVIVKHPPYRARVRKGNVVNSSYSFRRSDLPEWVLLK